MTRAEPIFCRYCRSRHMPRFLCDSAKGYLDAMVAKGASYNMPTVEFDDPLPSGVAFLGPDDRLVTQLVVKAATVPLHGVVHPMLILSGRDANQRALPNWMYAATPEEMVGLPRLVTEMAEMAIRRATP